MISRFDQLVIFIILQVGDVMSTNMAIGRAGVTEINPIVRALMVAHGENWWVAPKIALVAAAILVMRRVRWRWPLAALTALYIPVVLNNLLIV